MLVTADLTFQVDVPGRSAAGDRCVGRVQADGQVVTVAFDPMPSLGGSSTRPLVRPLAKQLHDLGLTVVVAGPDGPLIRVGAEAHAPRWQQILTRGLHVELVSLRSVLRSFRGPQVFKVALPPAAVLPAVTHAQRTRRRRVSVAARQVLRRATGRRR